MSVKGFGREKRSKSNYVMLTLYIFDQSPIPKAVSGAHQLLGKSIYISTVLVDWGRSGGAGVYPS